MIHMSRNAIAFASFLGALLAPSAHAVVPMTYIFELTGSGLSIGFDGVSQSTYFEKPFSSAQVTFFVPDVTGASFLSTSTGGGNAMLFSSTTGLGFRFDTTFYGVSGTGGACFSNPSGLFPTGPVSLVGGCGSVTYTEQFRYSSNTFSGLVTSLRVIPGSAGNGVPSASLTSLPAVPEPASWVMLLVGFGAIGYAHRSRRKVRSAPPVQL